MDLVAEIDTHLVEGVEDRQPALGQFVEGLFDEAGGTLLDNSLILFGSSLSNPTVHSQRDLPVMLAGGAAGRVRGGRMVKLQGDTTPLTNLHLSLLDQLGIPTEKLGDSTGMFNRLGI